MIYARLRSETFPAAALQPLGLGDGSAEPLIEKLKNGGLEVDPGASPKAAPALSLVDDLARRGLLEFHLAPADRSVVLTPVREGFDLRTIEPVATGEWKLSRFAYMHVEGGRFTARSPLADCLLRIEDPGVRSLLLSFEAPLDVAAIELPALDRSRIAYLCGLFARARLILPLDESGRTSEERDPAARQWGFHELVFHSLSRLGRTEKPIGGTYAFRGEIPPPPPLKPIPEAWTEVTVPLPWPDLAALAVGDIPLSAAIERRRSIRQYSVVPPSRQQLGEFLFRTCRVRSMTRNDFGEFANRPYPGGGACYEMEIYVTVDACLDVERGFYYYDPYAHRLCRISRPDARMEGLLHEAFQATAGQGRPQILLTLASRFDRFNWKYSSMSYAAQLKNVGVIYQTMYLVATSMNLGGCGLGIGNADRFAEMTGLDYLAEGSIGEFMLGRPL